MEKQQELEWEAAQNTEINVDLVSAAKRQLKFLKAVDRNRWLYDSPGLDRAIYRYNAYWLPLLAKYSESPLFEGPLVVPLDCEWIWHSHRLNPVRYKKDCEEFYGRILDNKNVISSVEGTSRKQTEDAWKILFPGEPFELDLELQQESISGQGVAAENFTKYDLIAAAQRQAPFFYQVSQCHMNDTHYIIGAVARYKGFLHLIKRNKEKGIKSFSVPTYDIDLIWHTHQLHPVFYCEDLLKIMGKILEHDDTDSDRTKGQKLDVGFTGTTKTFEDLYGHRYWRAGAMYKGNAPSPVRLTPYLGTVTKKVLSLNESPIVALPATKVFEVMLEFVSVRNLPEGHNGSLCVSFSKSQPDMIFNAKRTLKILSEYGEKQVACFQCEPTGNLLFELMSSPSVSPLIKKVKNIGTTFISLEDFLSPDSNLTVEKWLDLVPSSHITESKPIGLRVAISVTIPTPAPHKLHMVRSRPFSKSSCLFPLPVMAQFSKNWARIVDEEGNMVLNLHMRDQHKSKGKKESIRKVVVRIMDSGKACTLAEFAESKWSMVNSPWSLKLPNTNNDDGHLFEMTGPHTVRLFLGGRLDYESRRCAKHKAEYQHEPHLITAVKFSTEEPYGTTVALLDMKSGTIKVKEDWFVMPGLILTFMLGNTLRKEGHCNMALHSEELSNEAHNLAVGKETNQAPLPKELVAANTGVLAGGCGGCGSGCGNGVRTVESGGCGSMTANTGGCGGCGSGCGSMMAKDGVSGGCGSGCGGGCGGGCGSMMAKDGVSGGRGSGCGGGCGGGCGSMMTKDHVSGGCGGCGSMMGNSGVSTGGSKNMEKSGGCGGCGAGGCVGMSDGGVNQEIVVA
ncbi:glycine-rich domain-containing protein 1-like [Salvia splendens]|uniref:glycine-rich domain-containing protein 1-like n=1 Tax=Salvia splendens TaxID=180675 RepID=UPI001C27A937|nr:glycine-rich domain-containing protein 1-like [Salvia splendens]XP_042027843.1 glycine-rich domain-containing protein 1-like [Salvia splendens]